MQKKIIILGGNGILGSALANKLSSQKNTQVVVVDIVINKIKNVNKNITFIQLDIEKATSKKLEQILKGSSVVFYKIGKPGNPSESTDFNKCWNFISINSLGFWKIVKVAEKLNIKKLIVASSITAISDLNKNGPYPENTMSDTPPNFYGLSKAILEDISNYKNLFNKLKILVIRYPRIYFREKNNFLIKFAKQITIKNNLKIYGNLNKYIDLIHLDDAVNFALKCIDYKGSKNIFHVTYNKCLKIEQMLRYLSNRINSKKKLKLLKMSFNPPRESDKAFLKDIYSSKTMKIKFKYNVYKIIDDAIDFAIISINDLDKKYNN
tara:strand:- start:1678 stop:2643 length:966 start_codon:yes stop_codon:yes gene_type:complete